MDLFTICGKVKNGRMSLIDSSAFSEFLSQYPDKRFIAQVRICEPASNGLRAYYFGKVVPDIQRAFTALGNHMTKKMTDEFLRSVAPMMQLEQVDEQTGEWLSRPKSISEVSDMELSYFVEWCCQFAAENLYIHISLSK